MVSFNNIKETISNYFARGSERSQIIKKNIAQSFGFKVLSIILSLLIVPITIHYVEVEQYGIWLTLSSIVGWIRYFDLGLGHGLRNKYAEAKAIGDSAKASKYVSTTYAIFSILFIFVFLIFLFINKFINWVDFLKISQLENSSLQLLMIILVGFFSLTMILKVINSLLLGDQKTAFTSGITVFDQLLSLLFLSLLVLFADSNLVYLSFVSYGIPCVVLLIITFYLFSSKGFYHHLCPSFKNIDFKLSRNLFNLGVKFFIIQVSLLVIFQFVNIIISRNCGQVAVTQYNLSFKYFNIFHMVAIIILTPYWSAFTDAYSKKDYNWMTLMYKKLCKYSIYIIPILILMTIIAPLFFYIWIGNTVSIPFLLHLFMGVYMGALVFSAVQMYLLNGLGKVNLQLYIYVMFAFISIPLMNYLSQKYGLYGILIVLITVYLVQGIVGRIQIKRILNKTATGIWNR